MRGGKLVIDGSANLRSSRNIEQLRIECDAALFDYIEGFTDKIFTSYSVVNRDNPYPKPIRGGRLWGAITD